MASSPIRGYRSPARSPSEVSADESPRHARDVAVDVPLRQPAPIYQRVATAAFGGAAAGVQFHKKYMLKPTFQFSAMLGLIASFKHFDIQATNPLLSGLGSSQPRSFSDSTLSNSSIPNFHIDGTTLSQATTLGIDVNHPYTLGSVAPTVIRNFTPAYMEAFATLYAMGVLGCMATGAVGGATKETFNYLKECTSAYRPPPRPPEQHGASDDNMLETVV